MSGFVLQGHELDRPVEERCDVCIVGSGAGGAVLAAGLVEMGLDVVMLEAGGYHTRRDFDLNEGKAYPLFYQDRSARSTDDQAIAVLQGRTVGGGTTINWTTCFRTPGRILEHWQRVHGIEGLDEASLAPAFEAVEARLNIHPWPEAQANPNNRALLDGAKALGWEASPLRRNVRGCANSGFCGVGCPVDGKQSMHVTFLPDAVAGGMRLYSDVEVDRVELDASGVARAVHGHGVVRGSFEATRTRVRVQAKVVVLAGGAINSPALLLRSGVDGGGRVGARTFLHPVIAGIGVYAKKIEGYFGAPQSIGSHQFIDRGPDKVGYFLEAAPLQPMLASISNLLMGAELRDFLARLPQLSGLLALHVDGLLPQDEGGVVRLGDGGRPRLSYPVQPWLVEAMRSSQEALLRVHLAAGAEQAGTTHPRPVLVRRPDEIGPALAAARFGAHEHAIFSAHQMGGCAMGPDPARSVVGPDHRVHGHPNLFVVDGSVLPTALGVNPSQTIYALAWRARAAVAGAV